MRPSGFSDFTFGFWSVAVAAWSLRGRVRSIAVLESHRNSGIGSRQQLANVTVTEILLDGYRITTSHNVTCLGVAIDAELTFVKHLKRVASRCFYQLRQLMSVCLSGLSFGSWR